MSVERAELAGTGAAVLFHAALIGALSMSLAKVAAEPEPPSMEVELVDEVALAAAAPSAAPTPPPAAQAPELGPPEPIEPAPAPPAPVPTPAPRIEPARPTPPRSTTRPARPAPPKPAPRGTRLGDDFLKGIAEAPSPAAKPAPSAARYDASAKADVASAIRRQIAPCAERQRALGAEAVGVRVTLNLRLRRNGGLASPPRVVRVSGGSGDPAIEELVADQAIAVYQQCSPLRLPAELYQTPDGGWSNINIIYSTRG